MFLLCGYKQNQNTYANIHIFGIFKTFDDLNKRIEQIDSSKISIRASSSSPNESSNILYTTNYVFWYKIINDIEMINTPVSNIS